MKFRWQYVSYALLLAVPATGLAWWLNRGAAYDGQLNGIVFILALVSLVPLATLIGEMTDRLSYYYGDVVGGLLNATLSNVPELAIGVFLLIHATAHSAAEDVVRSDITIIRGLVLGSVINNILLVLGLAVFAGALRHGRMRFDKERASGYASMLALAVVGLALPTLASAFTTPEQRENGTDISTSVVVGVILLISYIAYVASTVFNVGEFPKLGTGKRAEGEKGEEGEEDGDPEEAARQAELRAREEKLEAREERQRGIHKKRRQEAGAAFLLLWAGFIGVTVFTVIIAGLMVNVTDHVVAQSDLLTPLSVGLIVFPIVCNIGEIAGALSSGWRNRMELAMSVAAGSSVQVPLFVTPVLVFVSVALAAGHNDLVLSLIFQPIELIVVGLVTFVYALVNLDGETTWLEGLQLLAFYSMIAVTAFALPGR